MTTKVSIELITDVEDGYVIDVVRFHGTRPDAKRDSDFKRGQVLGTFEIKGAGLTDYVYAGQMIMLHERKK